MQDVSKISFLTDKGKIQFGTPTLNFELTPVHFYQNDYKQSFNYDFFLEMNKLKEIQKTAANKALVVKSADSSQ
jgi:hypothetical protein